jgi:hypothetical protein
MTASEKPVSYVEAGPPSDRRRIAVIASGLDGTPGGLVIVWLGGYRSDMSGTKAVVLEAHAEKLGIPFLRFDYSGHGSKTRAL